jgi:two-component system sensor histidine kinase HydH
MTFKIKNKKSWMGVPPWVLIGAVAVLLPIFTFITIENINRQKEKSTQLLLEKGAKEHPVIVGEGGRLNQIF